MKITGAWLHETGTAIAFGVAGSDEVTVIHPGYQDVNVQTVAPDDTWLPLKTSDGQPCTTEDCPDPRHATPPDALACGHSADAVDDDEPASAHVVEAISNNILGTTTGTVWQGGNVSGGLNL